MGFMIQEEYFNALYLEMYDMLLSYAESALYHQNPLAEEAVQDTFRIFWTAIQTEKELPNPRGWLVNTLKNVIQNIRRSQTRSANLLLALGSASPLHTTDDIPMDIQYGDLARDPDYILLKAFVLEHQTIKELSLSYGITVPACKKRLQRARERLKKYFEKNRQA